MIPPLENCFQYRHQINQVSNVLETVSDCFGWRLFENVLSILFSNPSMSKMYTQDCWVHYNYSAWYSVGSYMSKQPASLYYSDIFTMTEYHGISMFKLEMFPKLFEGSFSLKRWWTIIPWVFNDDYLVLNPQHASLESLLYACRMNYACQAGQYFRNVQLRSIITNNKMLMSQRKWRH